MSAASLDRASPGEACYGRPLADDERVELTAPQAALRCDLIAALKGVVPDVATLNIALVRADCGYRGIAEILVALRQECRDSGGRADLRGRSNVYRATVREAYELAGAGGNGPIPKRLTAGVSYWVRKLLLERYGEAALYEFGVLQVTHVAEQQVNWKRWRLPEEPNERLPAVVGLLNELATDSHVVPTREVLLAIVRAIRLLQTRLTA